ncbi:MAG: hypothetical protein RL095_3240 [Verrucomicrobiota bacterium]|jgi:hypothetical protein
MIRNALRRVGGSRPYGKMAKSPACVPGVQVVATIDIESKDGKVTHFHITSPEPREVKVRVNGELNAVKSEGI